MSNNFLPPGLFFDKGNSFFLCHVINEVGCTTTFPLVQKNSFLSFGTPDLHINLNEVVLRKTKAVPAKTVIVSLSNGIIFLRRY